MEIVEISQWTYFASTLASFFMLWHKQSIMRALLVIGYVIFSILYIADIEYNTAIGYFGWTAINFALFYEIIVADKLNLSKKRRKRWN